MDGKTKAIVAHIFLVGWIIAFILNMNDKEEITSFYLRQTLLLHVILFLGWFPFFGWIFWVVSFVFLLLSLISAINGEQKEIPIIGFYFQDWFKTF